MENKFNSFSRQSRIAKHSKKIRVSEFLEKTGNISDALEKLSAETSRIKPQRLPHNRSEMHKIEYLRAAVVDMSWAHRPLSPIKTGTITYQELVSRLKCSVKQEREEKEMRLRDNLAKSLTPPDKNPSGGPPGIL